MSTSNSFYGSFPGVRAQVSGGGVNGVIVGEDQKIVLFGRGQQNTEDAAPYNEPVRINTRVDATINFGPDSELTHAISGALRNGANTEYVYGVMPEEIVVDPAETIAGGAGQLEQYPIVEDTDLTVVNDVSGTEPTELAVSHSYESPPPVPEAEQTANVNPNTGEIEASTDGDLEVLYNYLDWEAALDAADPVLSYNETGVYCTVKDAESVTLSLQEKLNELRPLYKLIRGVAPAQPNATNAEGKATIDVDQYTDSIEDDALFVAGPTRLNEQPDRTIIGGIAGMFAGHELTNPVYGDRIEGYGRLSQQVTRSDEGVFRSARVIPIRDDGLYGQGGLWLTDNLSTSTRTDWVHDYHRRRIIDQVLLIGREVGEQAKNQRLTDSLMKFTEQVLLDEIEELVEAGLLEGETTDPSDEQGNTTDTGTTEQPYYVEVGRGGTDEITISIGITPVGLTKRIDEQIVVSDSGATIQSTA